MLQGGCVIGCLVSNIPELSWDQDSRLVPGGRCFEVRQYVQFLQARPSHSALIVLGKATRR